MIGPMVQPLIEDFCHINPSTQYHSWPQDSALRIPSPLMNLKAGALQALRLTTLMTSLEAVVLNQIRNSDKIIYNMTRSNLLRTFQPFRTAELSL